MSADLFGDKPPAAQGEFCGWVPDQYLDETCPAPREHPDQWIAWVDGRAFLAGYDEGDELGEPIGEGDEMGFSGLTDFPTIRVRWDGPSLGVTPLDPVPAGATMFMVSGEPESCTDNLDDLALSLEDEGEASEVSVKCYDWSDAIFTFAGGRFVRAGAAQ